MDVERPSRQKTPLGGEKRKKERDTTLSSLSLSKEEQYNFLHEMMPNEFVYPRRSQLVGNERLPLISTTVASCLIMSH